MSATPDFKKRLAAITRRNKDLTHVKHKPWPRETKQELVATWLATGNLRIASETVGVPYTLAKKWKQHPDWLEIEHELRLAENIELSNKVAKIINESLTQVADRLENGDIFYDQKSGEMRRRPAPLRDVHRVAADLLTKRDLLHKEQTYDAAGKLSVEEQLKMLAMEMAKWNRKQENTIELVEVEDAVYEEREAGLQEGAELGTYQEAESSEGPRSEERSPEDDGRQGPSQEG